MQNALQLPPKVLRTLPFNIVKKFLNNYKKHLFSSTGHTKYKRNYLN